MAFSDVVKTCRVFYDIENWESRSTLPKLRPSQEARNPVSSQPGRPMATTSLFNETLCTCSQMLNPESYTVPTAKPMASLATVNRSSAPKAKHPSQLILQTSRALHRSVREAALMFALALFYVIVYGKLENTFVQLIALLLSILLVFVSKGLESD